MIWEYSAGVIPFRESRGKRTFLLLLSGLTKQELWEFPKGLIEKKETAQEAALREFTEETGIRKVELVAGFKQVLKYFYRRNGVLVGKTVTYFLGRVGSSKVNISSESKDFIWLDYTDALQKIRQKNLQQIIKEANDYLNAAGKDAQS
jgi:8-oxo-dGTP pyrophosphatase MutT (NUDIX family)